MAALGKLAPVEAASVPQIRLYLITASAALTFQIYGQNRLRTATATAVAADNPMKGAGQLAAE